MSLRTLAALSTVFVLFGGPLAGSAWAEPLPRATPEQVGLSSERLGHVSHVLREEILKGKLPGYFTQQSRLPSVNRNSRH